MIVVICILNGSILFIYVCTVNILNITQGVLILKYYTNTTVKLMQLYAIYTLVYDHM